MVVTITPVRQPHPDAKFLPVDTTWDHNRGLFAACVRLGCVPMTAMLVPYEENRYYLLHHEEVVIYSQDIGEGYPLGCAAVKRWLDDHHSRLQGTLRL